ncbi:hypothetical protein ABK040_009432 [Willaertia magna]
MQKFLKLTTKEISEGIVNKSFTCLEVVQYFIARIENSQRFNAVCLKNYDDALKRAKELDQFINTTVLEPKEVLTQYPLFGVPITVKECIDVENTPTTVGLTTLKNNIVKRDALVVKKLKKAGAIILGKTNVAQLLCYDESSNPLYGVTNNPFKPERSSGGSSGGEATAIALGLSTFGIGTDIGGSIRLPSSHCGVYGPISRKVENIIEALKVMVVTNDEEYESNNMSYESIRNPPVLLRDPYQVDISKLRIALITDNDIISPSKGIQRGLKEAANALKELGATVEEWKLPTSFEKDWINYASLMFSDGMENMNKVSKGSAMNPIASNLLSASSMPNWLLTCFSYVLKLFGQGTYLASSINTFKSLTVRQFWNNVDKRDEFRKLVLEALDEHKYDAILCPSSALPAPTHGLSTYVVPTMSYCQLFNYLGLPAGVCPITMIKKEEELDSERIKKAPRDWILQSFEKVEKDSNGLPVAVQIAARYWREDIVLAIMKALEKQFEEKEDYPPNVLQKLITDL